MKNMKLSTGDFSKPPSYETLVKDGYIVVTKGDMAASIPVAEKEKNEKLFIA